MAAYPGSSDRSFDHQVPQSQVCSFLGRKTRRTEKNRMVHSQALRFLPDARMGILIRFGLHRTPNIDARSVPAAIVQHHLAPNTLLFTRKSSLARAVGVLLACCIAEEAIQRREHRSESVWPIIVLWVVLA